MFKNFIVLVLLIVLNISDYSNGIQHHQQSRIISNLKFNKLDSSKSYSAIEGFLINQKPLGNFFFYSNYK
jgi:hypothetical protein